MKFWYAKLETWGRSALYMPSIQSRPRLETELGSFFVQVVSIAITAKSLRWTKAVASAGTRLIAPPERNIAIPAPSPLELPGQLSIERIRVSMPWPERGWCAYADFTS